MTERVYSCECELLSGCPPPQEYFRFLDSELLPAISLVGFVLGTSNFHAYPKVLREGMSEWLSRDTCFHRLGLPQYGSVSVGDPFISLARPMTGNNAHGECVLSCEQEHASHPPMGVSTFNREERQ